MQGRVNFKGKFKGKVGLFWPERLNIHTNFRLLAMWTTFINPIKSLSGIGENHFLQGRAVKFLRCGIRPAKKFHRKVRPEALAHRAGPHN
jgi:hypothetical protein